MNDKRESVVRSILERYPNLEAIIDGRVSGEATEWPRIRAELRDLLFQLAVITHLQGCPPPEAPRESTKENEG